MFGKGPAPFFKKLLVNSAAIHFQPLEDFAGPNQIKLKREVAKLLSDREEVQRKGRFFLNQMKANPSVVEYFESNYLGREESVKFSDMEKAVV